MKTLNNLEQYSTQHDAIMNTSLEIIEGAYESSFGEYSIKVPHNLSPVSFIETFDGNQPCYSRDVEQELESMNLKADTTLADYPRHGDTLRLFYSDIEKAQAALYFIKQMKAA